jgi:hypothetical protein
MMRFSPLGRSGLFRSEKRLDDLPGAIWRKSTLCGNSSCIEVALLDDTVALRDSKNLEGPLLLFTHEEWATFIHGVRNGEFEIYP